MQLSALWLLAKDGCLAAGCLVELAACKTLASGAQTGEEPNFDETLRVAF